MLFLSSLLTLTRTYHFIMEKGTSYWTLRRQVRTNVARQIANLDQSMTTHSENEGVQNNDPESDDNQALSDISFSSDNGCQTESESNASNSTASASCSLLPIDNDQFEHLFDRHSITDESESDESDGESAELHTQIRDWAVKYQISNMSLSELLKILRPLHHSLPIDPRTLLKTVTSYNIMELGGGQYYHFGIAKGVVKEIQSYVESLDDGFQLKLQINIDGLPLFKSTTHQFWPILGKIQNVENQNPFVIGLFYGVKKPSNLGEYLSEFLNEHAHLQSNGIECLSKHFTISIDSVICDAPARAFIKCVKSYAGYYGCDKCTQEGEWRGKMTFPETNAPLRTDAAFNEMRDDDHHNGISPLLNINVGMVSQIPIDYMHLVCLGVMKRLLLLWMKGPLRSRLGAGTILKISENLSRLKNSIPSDFARKPRILFEIERWKATEFRQFLLYTGIVVLPDCVNQHIYENFLLLSVGMHILLNNVLCHSHNQYAHDLLVAFVRHFCQIYGNDMAVYNVHGLVHLAAEAEKYGSLDNISAFPFANFMSRLKKLVRKPTFPLPQVIRRLSEQAYVSSVKQSFPVLKHGHQLGPLPDHLCLGSQYKIVKTEQIQLKLNEKDCCVRINGKVCLVKNIVLQEGDVYVVYSEFSREENFFTSPLDSGMLGIYLVSNIENSLHFVSLKDIESKCVLMPYKGKYVAIPYTDSTW